MLCCKLFDQATYFDDGDFVRKCTKLVFQFGNNVLQVATDGTANTNYKFIGAARLDLFF